jgi:hypothetical protein
MAHRDFLTVTTGQVRPALRNIIGTSCRTRKSRCRDIEFPQLLPRRFFDMVGVTGPIPVASTTVSRLAVAVLSRKPAFGDRLLSDCFDMLPPGIR